MSFTFTAFCTANTLPVSESQYGKQSNKLNFLEQLQGRGSHFSSRVCASGRLTAPWWHNCKYCSDPNGRMRKKGGEGFKCFCHSIKNNWDYSCSDLWATVQQFSHGRGKGDLKGVTFMQKVQFRIGRGSTILQGLVYFIYGKAQFLSKDINTRRKLNWKNVL